MEQIDQNLIERYLADELTPSERSDFERRAENDPQFRKDLAAYKLSLEAIKLTQRDQLLERFRQRDKMLDRKNNTTSGSKGISFWWLAVAAAISVLVAWYFLYTPDQITDEAKNEKKDTIPYVQIPPVIVDTSKTNVPENENEIEKDKNKKQDTPLKSKPTNDQLFAANFEAYRDESMDITSRSDEEDLTPTDKLLINYWEGNFGEAQKAFNNMTPADKQNDNYRFIYANILMSLNKTVEASLLLKGIIKNNKSPYALEAYFYLALCDIKSGKNPEALENLKIYIADKNSTQKEKAQRILAGLK